MECFCSQDRRSGLCNKLKAKEYGAHEAEELFTNEGSNIFSVRCSYTIALSGLNVHLDRAIQIYHDKAIV